MKLLTEAKVDLFDQYILFIRLGGNDYNGNHLSSLFCVVSSVVEDILVVDGTYAWSVSVSVSSSISRRDGVTYLDLPLEV